MPNPATDTPVAPAAASPAPAPVAPKPPEPPKDYTAMASQLMNLLADTKDKKTDEPKADEPAKKDEPAPAPAPVVDKPIKVREKKKPAPEAPPPLPKAEPVVPFTPAPATPKPAQSDEEFEKDLMDEEKEQLETARLAEKQFPGKYKGIAARTKNFLKEHAERVNAADFNEADDDYQNWVKQNMPKIAPLDVRKIDEQRITERVTKQHDSKYDELRQEMYARDEEPKILKQADQDYRESIASSLPPEVNTLFEEKVKEFVGDINKALVETRKEYGLEFKVAETIAKVATEDISEFVRLTTVNPQTGKALKPLIAGNEQHERILALMDSLCETFRQEGGEKLKKDGKWFCTRKEYWSMTADQQRSWWTFDNAEIVRRAKAHIPVAVNGLLKQQRETLEKEYGYVRAPRATAPGAPAAAPVPPTASAPAAPRPAPVPGAGNGLPPSLGAQLAARLQQQAAS